MTPETEGRHGDLYETALRLSALLTVEQEARRRADAEIERLTAEVAALTANSEIHNKDWSRIADIRAAGYEAGQRAMREAAVTALKAGGAWHAPTVVEALPILPEPQEPQP